MTEDNRRTEASIRRAPKYPVFILVGGALGILAALILTLVTPTDPTVGFGATFGFFAVLGVTVGFLLGAIVALVLDRRSSRRARTVSFEVEHPDDSSTG